MKPITKTLAIGVLAIATSAPIHASIGDVPAGEYKLEETHGYITFTYSHLGFSNPVVGFTRFNVTLDLDQNDVQNSALSVSIDPASIESNVEKFNDHLKSDDFFDVANYPDLSFTATSIAMSGDNSLTIVGDLTAKGITKPVTLDATINKAATNPISRTPTIGVSASGTLKRSDWDLGLYAPNVGDEVTLNIQVELIPADPEA